MNNPRLTSEERGLLLSAVNEIIFALKVENKEKLPQEKIRKAKATLICFLVKAREWEETHDRGVITLDDETSNKSRINLWFLLLLKDELKSVLEFREMLDKVKDQIEKLEPGEELKEKESPLDFVRKVRDRLLSDASQPMERVTIAEL